MPIFLVTGKRYFQNNLVDAAEMAGIVCGMDEMRKRRITAALVALEGLTHAEVSRLIGGLVTPETVSNVRRGRVKRIPMTTIIALETAARTLSRQSAA